jgi:hypothetical protein
MVQYENLDFETYVKNINNAIYDDLISHLNLYKSSRFREINSIDIKYHEHNEYISLLDYLLGDGRNENPLSPKRRRLKDLEIKYMNIPVFTIPNEKSAQQEYVNALHWMFEYCKL